MFVDPGIDHFYLVNVKNNAVGRLYVQISEKYYTFRLTFSFDEKGCIYRVRRLINVACWERGDGDENTVGTRFIGIIACLLAVWYHKGALKKNYILTVPRQSPFDNFSFLHKARTTPANFSIIIQTSSPTSFHSVTLNIIKNYKNK
jgi:hypothetical protein